MLALIPSTFEYNDDEQEMQREVRIGIPDENEKHEVGKSATQWPRQHSFQVKNLNNLKINLIDTPGVGDTGGIEKDRENFQNILDFLKCYEKLHAVCILMKPNQARLTVAFRFCVQELLSHLHISLAKNMMFCFTHTRGTFYNPGDTLKSLRELLKEKGVNVTLKNKTTYFCFDNESFRMLACLNEGITIDKKKLELFSGSWSFSSEMTHTMFDHIRGLPPHETQNTISMNNAKSIVTSLGKPMAEILQLIEHNKEEGEKRKLNLQAVKHDIAKFKEDLEFPGYSLETTKLENPSTVCTHADCVKHVQVGASRVSNTVYDTVCHENCGTKGLSTETANNKNLKNCRAFRVSRKYTTQKFDKVGQPCNNCQHDYKLHMHITYTTKIVQKKFFSEGVQKKIEEKGNLKDMQKEALEQLQNTIEQLEGEREIIMSSAAKFAAFMMKTALIAYNDAFNEYLDQLIEDEKSKPDCIRDLKRVTKLKEDKEKYAQQINIIKDALKLKQQNKDTNIEAKDIYELRDQLYKLPHFGSNIKDMIGITN